MGEPRVLNKRFDFISPDAVYIGRPSPFGNPFKVDEFGRDKCIQMYEEYLLKNPSLLQRVKTELRGKDLVCWCSPANCHGDVLLRIANS